MLDAHLSYSVQKYAHFANCHYIHTPQGSNKMSLEDI